MTLLYNIPCECKALHNIAPWPSGKATDSDSVIPRFESLWRCETQSEMAEFFCCLAIKEDI